ncbi:MAG: hypothetical protein HZC55_18215 [Verrucomicrobia bacterium]|nr:hypothetical protein [Verrucomicrobiota bacterium]
MRLDRSVVLVAGSIAPDCDAATAAYAHEIAREAVAGLAPLGVRFEIMPGRLPALGAHGLPVAFDWEIIRSLSQLLAKGLLSVSPAGPFVACTTTLKTLERIPPEYRADWDRLLAAKAMHLRFVPPGWASGAIRRSRAAEFADVLLAIGGGEGIEHLATEFLRRARPVVPLDLNVAGSSGDGAGGSGRLLREFLGASNPPYVLRDGSSPNSVLSRLALKERLMKPKDVAAHIAVILDQLRAPRAFFVRLLADSDPNFAAVEAYFRKVVDPSVADLGYEKFEMGSTPSRDAWMNQEIFRNLGECSIAVVDITSLRFNCGIELGFALGRNKKIILSAMDGTRPPFDVDKWKMHFWKDPADPKERARFLDHWGLVRNRDPVAD